MGHRRRDGIELDLTAFEDPAGLARPEDARAVSSETRPALPPRSPYAPHVRLRIVYRISTTSLRNGHHVFRCRRPEDGTIEE